MNDNYSSLFRRIFSTMEAMNLKSDMISWIVISVSAPHKLVPILESGDHIMLSEVNRVCPSFSGC